MKFAFDIDGTISAAPEEFAAIIKALNLDGHETHILTGTMDQEITLDHYQRRHKQLQEMGVELEYVTWLEIVTNPPLTAKADYCEAKGIDMLFEDSTAWSEPCRDVCHVLLIQPKANG